VHRRIQVAFKCDFDTLNTIITMAIGLKKNERQDEFCVILACNRNTCHHRGTNSYRPIQHKYSVV